MVEGKVSKTMLEDTFVVIIEGCSYNVAQPSIATLVLFSKYVGKLPSIDLKDEYAIQSLLSSANSLINIAPAIASVILGAKEYNKKRYSFSKRTKGEVLTELIKNASVNEILDMFLKVLKCMRLDAFFQLTTSLIEMNLTKPTKLETIASGQ